MIKTIIFDLGNVIINVDHRSICGEMAKHSKYTADDIYRLGFNSQELKLYDEGKIKSEELFKWVVKRFSLDISYDIFQGIWSETLSLNDTVYALLQELKKEGYNLILLSNTNELHFDYIKLNFGVIDAFDDLVLSYRLGYSKPHEEVYREVLRRANSSAEDCVYIDDIEKFCEAAEKSGIKSITYRSTKQLITELKGLGVMIG